MDTTVVNRLQKAEEYLKEAEFLYNQQIGNLPVLTNLYHAMMNCLFALFKIDNIGTLTHADIIERFKKEFIEQGIFDRKFTYALDFAFQITHECNCEHMKPPGSEDIDKLFPVVREFLQTVAGYMRKDYAEF